MKRYFLPGLLFLVTSITLHSQSWQWGKRGGGDTKMYDAFWPEQVRAMATDAQGNVFAIAPVGIVNVDIDGVPKAAYGTASSSGASSDYMISSFACDGAYRWSKVIGGLGSDIISNIQLDSEGNVYTAGKFQAPSGSETAIHFDSDSIIPISNYNVNTYKKTLFIKKYDNQGNLQWVRMPQPDNINAVDGDQVLSFDFRTDPAGNTFWMIAVTRPSSFADSAYVVTTTGISFHVLKYNANGDFTGGFPLDMSLSLGGPFKDFKMARNPGTGTIYLAGYLRTAGDEASFGGQAVTHDMYIAAYTSTGQFLWKKESTLDTNQYQGFRDISLDADGSIYLTGLATNGAGFGGHTFVSSAASSFPFILKLNADGDVLWGSNGDTNATTFGGAITAGALTGGYGGLTWGGFSHESPGPDYDVFMVRFNTDTGAITNMDVLGGDSGYSEYGTAITKDVHGNFYVGGKFEHFLYANGAAPLINNGQETDFFIAKFGTADCTLAVNENEKPQIKAWPNPVDKTLTIDSLEGETAFALYDVTGREVRQGIVEAARQAISFEGLRPGLYLLILKNAQGETQSLKIIKE